MKKMLKNYSLSGSELLEMEQDLAEILKKFLIFSKLSLYFPSSRENLVLTFLPAESLCLIPVKWQNKIVAMIKLENIQINSAIIPHLEKLVELALEKICLEKLAFLDISNNLLTEEGLFKHIEEEITLARNRDNILSGNFYRLCLGMLVISWDDEQYNCKFHDSEFSEKIFRNLAFELNSKLIDNVIAAQIGKYEGKHDFGIIVNTAGREYCTRLALKIMREMEDNVYIEPLSGRKYSPRLYSGHALYPQDMTGEELRLPLFEQITKFKERAVMAMRMAKNLDGKIIEERILPYSDISGRAGRIIDYRGKDQIRINLGRNFNVQEGMRFFVLGKEKNGDSEFIKGQITILKAEKSESVARIFYLNKAENIPQRGDRLSLPSDILFNEEENAPEKKNNIVSHAEFLLTYPEKVADMDRFLLLIIRIHNNFSPELINKVLSEYILIRQKGNEEAEPELMGNYGKDRIIILLPDASPDKEINFLTSLSNKLEGRFSCGIAQYPFLDFSRMDMESNALKALEYAELLPKPNIGIFNSMAITISADKKYSLGDKLDAIEDYKRAIIADNTNALAQNSLGVCYASLGKNKEAQNIWQEALENADNRELKGQICYNLGTLCQKEGNMEQASRWYRSCLKNQQKHIFAWLRMGQLNETRKRKKSARRYYLCAANLADINSVEFVISQRCLIKLAINSKDESRARKILNQLIYKDPNDISSINMLANIYLQENGDPAISKMLAKKSLQIRDNQEAWRILSLSLSLLGEKDDAEKARERAERKCD